MILAVVIGIVAVILFLAIGSSASSRGMGLLGAAIGEDGRLSLSKFQFMLWTGTVIFTYVTLFVEFPSQRGQWSSIPDSVLLAMGFSIVTLATAKGITTSYVALGKIVKNPAMRHPRMADLVVDDDTGFADLSKVQMLAWTLIAVGAYLTTVLSSLSASTPPQQFPDIDRALMVLMGLGQGAYLGTKIASASSGASIASINPEQGAAGEKITLLGSSLGKSGMVIFGNTKIQPTLWTDTVVQFTVPSSAEGGVPPPNGSDFFVALLPDSSTTAQTTNSLKFTLTQTVQQAGSNAKSDT